MSRIKDKISFFIGPLVERFEQLINLSRQLAAMRDFEALGKTAKLIPAPIGQYYEALAGNGAGFNIAGLRDGEKPRVLVSIAQTFRAAGDLVYAARIAREARALAVAQHDWFSVGNSSREMAVSLSMAGNHRAALNILQSAAPRVNAFKHYDISCATLFADLHNSLAVELAYLDRREEAGEASRIALASPFSHRYPEWRETADSIQVMRPGRDRVSVLAFTRSNVIDLPERHGDKLHLSPPANVLPFMVKQRKAEPEDDSAEVRQALREEIFHLITNENRDEISQETLQEMVRLAKEGMKSKQAPGK